MHNRSNTPIRIVYALVVMILMVGASGSYVPVDDQVNTTFVPPVDPLYSSQWYLDNTSGGVDINVVPAWTDGYTGKNVTIAIVGDGVQYDHPDLSSQYVPGVSYDFIEHDGDPMPIPSQDIHGTVAAGIAAAKNDTNCGVGVAYDAKLSALRVNTDAPLDDTLISQSLSWAPETNYIYSNSWGPFDDGLQLQEPGPLTLAALQNGVTNGRLGKGSIYVWAAGNGFSDGNDLGRTIDNVNYDGYANSRYTIAVGSVDDTGVQTNYSEPGAAVLITAPSGSSTTRNIATTDLMSSDGFNTSDCVTDFGSTANYTDRGTSASAPIVSGVVALMLEANPNLGWRDVQYILAQTAVQNDPTDADWTTNHATPPLHINHKYGFGLVDAGAAVALAKTWTNAGTLAAISSGTIAVNQNIPDNYPAGITSNFVINQNVKLEHVQVVFNATHSFRGDLEVVLTSPSGTKSVLATKHDDTTADYNNWKFMTVRDWGESSNGTWSLQVIDTSGDSVGEFNSWKLNLYGTVPAGTNDDISVPNIILAIPYQSIEDTITSTVSADDPTVPACGLNKGENSVWYSYTPATTKTIYFDTYGSSYDTFIAVWTGSRGALVPVTCNNDSASTLQSAVGFTATAFTTYHIEVAQYNGILSPTNASPAQPPPKAAGGILRFQGTSFKDVPGTYWAWNYIEGLYNAGITSGCGVPGNYCPATSVSRAQMAIFLVRATHGTAFIPPVATGIFPDVPVGSFAADYIEQLFADGITSGCGNGNFCPTTSVTRAQMAIFLLRGKNWPTVYTPPPATGILFADVPLGVFGAAWIEQLSAEGITSGCTPTTYCPNKPVTRAQMAVFLDKTFEYPALP